MMVYHGSTAIVERPDTAHSFRALDFGKGFYVTTVFEQAARWARRKADIMSADRAVVNQYDMRSDMEGLRVKTFDDDLLEWIDFVCGCRDGATDYTHFDIIMGKVANDRVFRVVDMYHTGIWDKQRALKEIRAYPNYDQIAFITEKAIQRLLTFETWMEV